MPKISKDAKINKIDCLVCYKSKKESLIITLPCCKKQICKCCINKIKKSKLNYRCPHCRQSSEVFKCKEEEEDDDDEYYMMDQNIYEEYLEYKSKYESDRNLILNDEEEYEFRMEWYGNLRELQANREWEEYTEEDEILNRRSQSP